MYMLLASITSLALIAFVIGMISPRLVVRWGDHRTRGKVAKYYGLGTIGLLLLSNFVAPDHRRPARSDSQAEVEIARSDSASADEDVEVVAAEVDSVALYAELDRMVAEAERLVPLVQSAYDRGEF